MHGFPEPAAIERGLVLGQAARGLLDVDVGDRCGFGSPARTLTEPVTGLRRRAARHLRLHEPRRASAPRPTRRSSASRPARTATRPCAGSSAARASPPSVDTAGLKALIDQYLGLFYAFVGIMLVFAAALAFAIMFTTTSANLAERTIEVTTLRASGVAHRTLARLLRAENLLLTRDRHRRRPAGRLRRRARSSWPRTRATSSASTCTCARGRRRSTAVALLAVALLSEWPGLRALAGSTSPASCASAATSYASTGIRGPACSSSGGHSGANLRKLPTKRAASWR